VPAASGSEPWDIAGYADDDPRKAGAILDGYPVLGTIAELAREFAGEHVYYFCAIGKNQIRRDIANRVAQWNWQPATLIHPSAIVVPGVIVAAGAYVGPGAILCPRSVVGSHVILNTHVSVGHDARIGDFAQACPGVRISGGSVIEELAFLGSNASVGPGVTVGRGATIGANSFVCTKIRPGITAIGIPAQTIACAAQPTRQSLT
jgi:sugar O-acyltransferase (sialic acid O-acetyltransferase NeuD family)